MKNIYLVYGVFDQSGNAGYAHAFVETDTVTIEKVKAWQDRLMREQPSLHSAIIINWKELDVAEALQP